MAVLPAGQSVDQRYEKFQQSGLTRRELQRASEYAGPLLSCRISGIFLREAATMIPREQVDSEILEWPLGNARADDFLHGRSSDDL
jgi:hypothetical protein